MLTGKIAIVTGSTDGIGLAIARRLCQDGAKVMVSSRKKENVDKAVQELTAEKLAVAGTVCHVGKAEDRTKLIQETVSQFGGLDILVANVATNPHMGPMLNCQEWAWDKIFDTNLKATFFLCKEAVPHMKRRRGGSVVFMSSIAGYIPFENVGAYSVSKTALFGLTKALVPQLSSMNIRVNCVAPGVIDTRFSNELWKIKGLRDSTMDMIPTNRFAEPSEVSGLVSFLVSEDASYMMGECLVVGGGMHARL